MINQITNTWKIMILQNRQNIYHTLIWIICIVGQRVVIFLMVDFGFMWLKNIDGSDVNSIEVDLEYPDELPLLHNDYPLVPEKIVIPYDMLSDHCK